MIESAGTLLYRRNGERLEVLIVHPWGPYNRRAPWSIPKGRTNPGEDLEAAARRELFEETGLSVGRASLLGQYWDRYDLPGFGAFPTLNHYWLARWRSGTPRAADDAAEAHWVPLEEVRRPSLQRRFAWAHMREVMHDLMRDPKRGAGRRGPG